ncbi:MAG TPA: M24 family metallopeptidase [Candidatus Limnocylindria bacterium]|nr:M24 family metallopeptidase [Candidatus Limnocylindria bacterium]
MFHTDLTPFGVDMTRLEKGRLARLQAAMKRDNLGALLLTDFLNIRYATNTVMMLGLRATGIQRFALIPAQGEPLICQRELSRKNDYRSMRFDAYMFAMRPPVATDDFVNQAVMAIKQLGAAGERVGVDYLNLAAIDGLKSDGIELVDGWPAINQARVIKTPDEIQIIRWTTKAKERGYDLVRQALRESNPPEDKLSRIMLDYLMDQGFEAGSEFISIYDSSVADTRPHNEPMGADLVVKEGELVICDATVAGPGGYYSDFARTFSAGTPTAETKQRYREAYYSLQEAVKLVQPGPCTEAFRRFGKGASATVRLPGFDGYHGVGLCIYESPWLRGGDPEKYMISLEENMIVALEINHYPVKLEHLLRVTADGAEILSQYPVDPELVPA